jgi:hypothetical protein
LKLAETELPVFIEIESIRSKALIGLLRGWIGNPSPPSGLAMLPPLSPDPIAKPRNYNLDELNWGILVAVVVAFVLGLAVGVRGLIVAPFMGVAAIFVSRHFYNQVNEQRLGRLELEERRLRRPKGATGE